jgi:hypothetical protein
MAKGELAKALAEKALKNRSPLYLWLRANYRELLPGLSGRRPMWGALAEMVGEKAGLTDPSGALKPAPTPSAARAAWLLVKRDMEEAAAGAPVKRAVRTRNRATQTHAPVAVATRSAQPSPKPAPDATPSSGEDQVNKILAGMAERGGGSAKVPKIVK